MKKVIMAACVAVSLTAFAGLALADKDHKSIPKTAVSLEQAIKAVTDKYPGRVINVGISESGDNLIYSIKLIDLRNRRMQVRVNANQRRIVGAKFI